MERMKALGAHVERIREVQEIAVGIAESDWTYYISLLETLYENVDNPDHLDELN